MAVSGKIHYHPWIAAVGFSLMILTIALLESLQSKENLAEKTLATGRIVLSSETVRHPADDPQQFGIAENILDGNLQTPAILRWPAPPPEGAYLLMDLGLSHWPGRERGEPPRLRSPHSLTIFNPVCSDCDGFPSRYATIQRARVELLVRRANDPDTEFLIPPARVIYSTEVEIPAGAHSYTIPLALEEPFPESPGYPENMLYIIGKITILSIHPGSQFQDRVAVTEVQYRDSNPEGEEIHTW